MKAITCPSWLRKPPSRTSRIFTDVGSNEKVTSAPATLLPVILTFTAVGPIPCKVIAAGENVNAASVVRVAGVPVPGVPAPGLARAPPGAPGGTGTAGAGTGVGAAGWTRAGVP